MEIYRDIRRIRSELKRRPGLDQLFAAAVEYKVSEEKHGAEFVRADESFCLTQIERQSATFLPEISGEDLLALLNRDIGCMYQRGSAEEDIMNFLNVRKVLEGHFGAEEAFFDHWPRLADSMLSSSQRANAWSLGDEYTRRFPWYVDQTKRLLLKWLFER